MMNLKDIQKKIARGEIKIEYASRDRILALRPWVQKVLEAVGHPEAFVTNQSILSDFWPMDKAERAVLAAEIGKKLGIRVRQSDYVVDVASRLRLGSLQ
jgi:hypothetical protein